MSRFRPDLRRWSRVPLWGRRAIKTIVAITALILVSSLLYHYLLITFEGRSPRYGHSLQVVIETYTGTGYGSDAPWESPVTNAFVSIMDLSTFLLLFIVFPYVFRPVLENALSPTVPTVTDASDHVVICGTEQQSRRLIEELDARGAEYVVIAATEEAALELVADDIPAIAGDPTAVETHRNARVDDARAVVVDTEDSRSVSALLAIREVDETTRSVVLVEALDHERHLRYAGADRVLTPRQLLGRRIAERILTETSPTRSDSVTLGGEFATLELTVFEDSPIRNRAIEEIEATAGGTVTVLGMWRDGRFLEFPDPETTVDENTVLLVAGQEGEIRDLEAETYRGRDVEPTVIVAGYGVVGSTVREALDRSTAECTVVDLKDRPDVSVVGDVTKEATLQTADIEDATVFVVTIADDDEAILSIVLADELATDLDIIARMNRGGNTAKARRAGADYALSLPGISGRVLAEEVLQEDVLSYGRQLKTVRIDADPYAGRTLGDTEIVETDCIVLAVEREGELVTDVGQSFELDDGDRLLLVGPDEELNAIENSHE
ncbi:NAD-binding protein [Natronomonas sp. F2-12]|jgi:Trk K+ transport system NAD-binding subunit|uniref:NAD-binding protein n=1 Tax=Natronomonas aquatica TaxID=2841590 RepID=A0A9R1D686_9EURY|nr:NAD-binding protein [Natronomonas aquatica]MCQ4332737.1 NAD-binding protein [Natronomonas aquatica]